MGWARVIMSRKAGESQHTSDGRGRLGPAREPMSETDSKLSAWRRDRGLPRRYLAVVIARGRVPASGTRTQEVTPMRLDASHKTFPRSRAGRLVAAAALPALLTVLVAAQPVSPSDAPAKSERGPSRLESTVDASIAPGDDFFAYANGGWLKATAIPAGKERWGGRDELEDLDPPPHRGAARRRQRRARRLRGAQGCGLPRRLPERGRHRGPGARVAQAAARSHREGVGQSGAHAPAGSRHARRRRPDGFRHLQVRRRAGALRGAEHPRREDQHRLPGARRAGPAGPRGLSRRRPREGGASSAVSRLHPDDAHARWPGPCGRARRARCWRWKRRSRKARPRARRRQTTTMPTTCGRVPTSRGGPPGSTGPSSSTRRGWPGRKSSSSGSRPP